MSALRIAIVLLLVATNAFADGTTRVLLADPDPELHRAIKAALAPWKLEVVIDANAPIDAPQTVADARFVVWRRNGELVVYDRDRAEAQTRDAPDGPLDPASAAAAALTVKTLMRLPPPDAVADATPSDQPSEIAAPVTTDDSGAELRVQGGLGTRVNGVGLGARANVAAFLKPGGLPLRIGIEGEVGSGIDLKEGNFRGTYRDWSVIALASWTLPIGKWEIEPYVGAGVLRTLLDGDEGMMERHERETLPGVRGGAFVRLRAGRLSVGGSASFDATLGTRAYTRTGSGSQFFEVPPFALSLGVFAAADLGR